MSASRTRGRPAKTKAESLSGLVQARFTADDKSELERAAEVAGLKFSEWIRDRLLSAARRELRRAGRSE